MKKIWLLLLPSLLAAQTLSIGPEAYYVKRFRATGAQQTGVLWGATGSYNRVSDWSFYGGADVYWASGILHGTNASGRALKSSLTDWQLEGRIGYSFPYFTPFIGYGYLEEQINFQPPSLTTFHYRDTVQYVTTGFLSRIAWGRFSAGLNAKIKWMTKGESKISNDPDNQPLTLMMENEMQYRVDLPLNYNLNARMSVSLAPFYEFRHYGGHQGYPFDFIDTKYQIWGTSILANFFF